MAFLHQYNLFLVQSSVLLDVEIVKLLVYTFFLLFSIFIFWLIFNERSRSIIYDTFIATSIDLHVLLCVYDIMKKEKSDVITVVFIYIKGIFIISFKFYLSLEVFFTLYIVIYCLFLGRYQGVKIWIWGTLPIVLFFLI